MYIVISILLIISGLITSVLFGFMGNLTTRRAQRISRLLGETVTRVLYVVVGIFLICFGIYIIINPELF